MALGLSGAYRAAGMQGELRKIEQEKIDAAKVEADAQQRQFLNNLQLRSAALADNQDSRAAAGEWRAADQYSTLTKPRGVLDLRKIGTDLDRGDEDYARKNNYRQTLEGINKTAVAANEFGMDEEPFLSEDEKTKRALAGANREALGADVKFYGGEAPAQISGLVPRGAFRQQSELEKMRTDQNIRQTNATAGSRQFTPYILPMTGQIIDRATGVARPIVDEAGQAIGAPPTTDMRNRTEARKLIGESISGVESLGNKVITHIGPAQRADAIKRGAEAAFGNDPEYRTYQDVRFALAGNLAVAQQGSRPSDADIIRGWLPLVPDMFKDTTESAKMKWDFIRMLSHAPTPDAAPVSAPPTLGEGEKLAADGVTVLIKNRAGQWRPK